MNTCKIQFSGLDARAERNAIRWALFLHKDVRDLLLTSRADTLCVVHRGAPDPAGWTATLKDAGYREPRVGPSTSSVTTGSQMVTA